MPTCCAPADPLDGGQDDRLKDLRALGAMDLLR
jgi:hypothetical protein